MLEIEVIFICNAWCKWLYSIEMSFDYRKLHGLEDECNRLGEQLRDVQTSCDNQKSEMDNLLGCVKILHAEKSESEAKLICSQTEIERLNLELKGFKVTMISEEVSPIILYVCPIVFGKYHNANIISDAKRRNCRRKF